MKYEEFLLKKEFVQVDAGFDVESMWLPADIKPFQRDCVEYACRRGRSALFADTGLGKTLMQLSWAHRVMEHTNKPVLVLAPLCVAQQTVREGSKFGISAKYMRVPTECDEKIHVTNYEMLKNFDPANYSGIVLDESSILKGMNGKLRKAITDFALTIPYRLSCTATPSPNDFMELGTQSEFLGIMSQTEMLATFFIHDGSDTSKWRLKGHARKKFWEWLATWAIVIRTPADLGYDDPGYTLPKLHIIEHVIETSATDGSHFWMPSESNTSVDVWQKYASPIWDDINQTDTLNFREGRDSDDERHICPLQLDVIERCLQLWSIPGDVVWTPFMGIGSEVYMALKMGRKAIGAELKPSYFDLALRNIAQAEKAQYSLF